MDTKTNNTTFVSKTRLPSNANLPLYPKQDTQTPLQWMLSMCHTKTILLNVHHVEFLLDGDDGHRSMLFHPLSYHSPIHLLHHIYIQYHPHSFHLLHIHLRQISIEFGFYFLKVLKRKKMNLWVILWMILSANL